MATLLHAAVATAAASGLLAGCSSPFDTGSDQPSLFERTTPAGATMPGSMFRDSPGADAPAPAALGEGAAPDEYVRYALFHNPSVEAAYQRWRAAAERLPQVGALPDPRMTVGFFLDEVETRVGPQQARAGVQQTFPWPGKLGDREDAASRGAAAAWRGFEAERLLVTERVVTTLHDLAYLDAAIRITGENLDLLRSFEEVVRARYRVGAGSHPDLIRVQVELGQLEDRLTQLRAMRPAYVAELNATLNRPADTEVTALGRLPGRTAGLDAQAMAELAAQSNPGLLAMDERVEEQRRLTDAARKDGYPDFTLGLEYISTADAMAGVPESGDDPIMVSFGVTLPIWREKYDAGVRETMARRLAISHERSEQTNRISAAIHRAWFDHTDAHRQVALYEQTLIPKAEESLRASLAGFRAGETDFLEVLDTERTLLEFAVAAERARADRGKALARLGRFVGASFPTLSEADAVESEVQQ